jgi:alginate O-acetyltransferase complex protein AlgI
VLFTSLHWVVFLATVFVVYHAAPIPMRRWTMLAASIYFYATWNAKFLALIGLQLLVDWTCGALLARVTTQGSRKLIVAASVVVNLSSLCVFKYYGLFSRSLAALGVPVHVAELTLPLAISFYTFESMSYTIDVYRGRLEPVRSPLHLALFVTWFPHLVAGPIIRPSEFVPQLREQTGVTRERFISGLSLMVVGYCKKLLIADWLAKVVEPAFASPGDFTSLELLIAVYAYAFQIYCDFSAYTDIARGASRWFGIELPENFNAPYLAVSITDFWRRWHMTLSHWLRDYLYVPLGGNRRGHARTYLNLMVTMLLGGLWHGANWTFVAWGGLHGIYLAIERALGVRVDDRPAPLARALRQVFTFHLVCLAWVFFRARSFANAFEVLRGIGLGAWHLAHGNLVAMLGACALIAIYWIAAPRRARVLAFDPGDGFGAQAAYAVAVGGVLLGLMVLGATTSAFIYFQF